MSLYICDRCHTIENTALGMFNRTSAHKRWFGDAIEEGEKLCSACTPALFADGSPNRKGGTWHNEFHRELATPEWIEAQSEGFKMTTGASQVLQGHSPKVKTDYPKAKAKDEL